MQDITEELEKNEYAISVLRPSSTGRLLQFRMLGPDGQPGDFEFYQDTLGMMPIQEFFTKVKAEIAGFVDGEYGIKLGELFRGESEMPGLEDLKFGSDGEAADKLDEVVDQNKPYIDAIFKLIDITPGLEMDIYVLSLGVQGRQEAWFRDAISEPPHRGGLTIDEGFDIIKAFIRQNAKAIRDFFTEEARSLAEVFQEEMADGKTADKLGRSTGGKQSSTSAPRTRPKR